MRHYLLLIIAAMSFFAASHAQETYCINTSKINLRDAPNSSSSNVLGQYTQGKQVIVFRVEGDWAQVLVDGINGYMWKDYLTNCPQQQMPVLGSTSSSNGGSGSHQSSTNSYSNTTLNSNYSDDIVIICNSPNAYAYHKYVCGGLSRCSYGTSNISRKKAESMGRTPCKTCY